MSKQTESLHDRKLQVRLFEASRLLSICERSLWAMANTGEIPSYKIGRSRFFSLENLEAYVAAQSEQSNKGDAK